MFRKKLDCITQMKHHNIAAKFVTKVICHSCVETEGLCHSCVEIEGLCLVRGDEDTAYAKCNYFHDAVRDIKKVLDKYNR